MVGKNLRQIAVFESLKRLKRARPDQIIAGVAKKFGVDVDEALKRSVHRDLKALADSNVLGIDYYTPGGELIAPGEEDLHANLRIEYYLVAEPEQEVTGGVHLKENSASLIAGKILRSAMQFSDRLTGIPKNSYVVSVGIYSGRVLHLWFPTEDRPLTLIFSRTSPAAQSTAFHKEVLTKLPAREGIVLLPDQSISSIKAGGTGGHLRMHFLVEENTFSLRDLGSRHGTTISTEPKTLRFYEAASEAVDINTTLEQPIARPVFRKVESEVTEKLPAVVGLGSTKLFIRRV